MLASGSPKESEEMWQDGDICPLGTWTIHHVQFLMSGGNKNHDFQISITTNLKQKYTQKTQMCVFQFAFCMSFLVIWWMDVQENARIYSLAVHKPSHFKLIFAQWPQGQSPTPMTDGQYLFCTVWIITFHVPGLGKQLRAAKHLHIKQISGTAAMTFVCQWKPSCFQTKSLCPWW